MSEIILYRSPDGAARLEVFFEGETFWLTQRRISELYGVDVRTVSEHLRNIFDSEELDEGSVVRKFRITATDGKAYDTQHYSLDAIIAVGYRVNSKQATQFRIWATATLKEFVIKGFVLDDERVKLNRPGFSTGFTRPPARSQTSRPPRRAETAHLRGGAVS